MFEGIDVNVRQFLLPSAFLGTGRKAVWRLADKRERGPSAVDDEEDAPPDSVRGVGLLAELINVESEGSVALKKCCLQTRCPLN